MGTGPLFFVGDQPSNADWGINNPNRRLFYDALRKIGIGGTHLTDIYKRRGDCSAMAEGLPDDFEEHLTLLKQEIEIVRPKRIIAIGQLAQRLLSRSLPEWQPIARIWHFAHVARAAKANEYEANILEAIQDAGEATSLSRQCR